MAETEGAMALIPYGEVKAEIRRQPKAVSILYFQFNLYSWGLDV